MSSLGVLRGPVGRDISRRRRPSRHDGVKITIDVVEDATRYCLLMHYQEAGEIGRSDEDMAPAMAAFGAYADDLTAAGVLIGAEVLDSVVTTTTVTKLGGIFVIEVGNRDEAIKWAQRNPANGWGSVEIRPVARTYAVDRGWYNP